ncbi:MAG: peptidylprolyl isomerase [Candidatus Sphingomonas colombiensis]|nr:peptidylprolyl isomerase [Sphingomonas sp.]WEK42751.1 MAG: peptidylprolyl isomerase [Sphingomonas sp.]
MEPLPSSPRGAVRQCRRRRGEGDSGPTGSRQGRRRNIISTRFISPRRPDRAEQVYANARQLIDEIHKGQAPFGYFAHNFSEASTRGVNGDLGWVRGTQLPDVLSEAAAQMKIGQVAGPVAVPGGFSILFLVDKRQVLTADPRDARLNLKQMTIKFPAGTTQAQASARTAEFANVTHTLQGCGSVDKVAAQIGAEVVDNDTIRVRDLPSGPAGNHAPASGRPVQPAVRFAHRGRPHAGIVRARRRVERRSSRAPNRSRANSNSSA